MKAIGCGVALGVLTATFGASTVFAPALAAQPSPVRLAPFGVAQAPGAIAVWNGVAFFAGTSPDAGVELWKSDGTPAGTALILDAVAGTAGASPQEITPFAHGVAYSCNPPGERLCASDGTAAGTRPLTAVVTFGSPLAPVRLASLGDFIFYQGTSVAPSQVGPVGIGNEPFRTDALAATTTAWNVWSFPQGASSSPTDFTALGNRMFFSAYDGVLHPPPGIYGGELWVVEGDQARGVADIAHAPGSSNPSSDPTHLTAVGSRLLFAADDRVTGRELWATDGTEAGTVRVRDINPGPTGSIASVTSGQNTPRGATAVLGGRMLFAADDGTAGAEPWISDGTETGTLPLADVNSGSSGSAPAGFTRVGDRVYFHADDGVHGREIWVTDGTPEGTHLAADAVAGSLSSSPVDPVAVGTVLVYQASDPQHGQELWVSDGSAAGTFRLADLEPGIGSSNPQGIAANSTHVFFAAQTTAAPRSIYSLSRSALGARLAARLSLTGARVRGGTITYTLEIENSGTRQPDAPGDEAVDVLPPGLTLVDAMADAGQATVDPDGRTVRWNGEIPAGARITITIRATVGSGFLPETEISNQANLSFDADADGTNEASSTSDDPGLPGSQDPTAFRIGLGFFPLSPCRIFDSRDVSPLGDGASVALSVVGSCGIPPSAAAIAANLTAIAPTGAGFLRAYPSGTPAPLASQANFSPGQTRTNNAVLELGLDGKLVVSATLAGGAVDFVIDVVGYFE